MHRTTSALIAALATACATPATTDTHDDTLDTEDTEVPDTDVARPTLTLTSPNGPSDGWAIGDLATVTYTATGVDRVDLLLSTDGGATWPVTLAEDVPASGSFTVAEVGVWATRDARVQVRASADPLVSDTSDASFRIPLTLDLLWAYNEALRTGCEGLGSDPDADGLYASSDAATCPDVEALVGTDPTHPDTDRDGVSDYLEVFGEGSWTPFAPLTDADDDGRPAPVDTDDNGDAVHDGAGTDADSDGIPNYLEFYGFTYDALADRFLVWDGDPTRVYYKSDPLQPSTDQDPYPDAMEVTGVLMDPSVRAPADHPMVPAFPNIVVTLEGYDVVLDADLTLTSGGSLTEGTTWGATTERSSAVTEETNWSAGLSTGVTAGLRTLEANVTVSVSEGGSSASTYTQGTIVSNGGNVASTEEWSDATSTNPAAAARISLHLRVQNIGSSTASDIVPALSLRIGDHQVATFAPGGLDVSLLQPGGRFPAGSNPWVVETDDQNAPLTLTLDELRSLETGAPVTIELVQLDADVYRQVPGGTWELIGTWDQYATRIEAVAAHLFLDDGEGRTIDHMVYADDTATSPVVTLRDALVWAAGAQEVGGALQVGFWTAAGTRVTKPVDGWYFNLDAGTHAAIADQLGDPGFDLLDTPLGPNSVVQAKAPPTEPTPRIHWVHRQRVDHLVTVYASDYFFPASELDATLVVDGVETPMTWNASGSFSASVPPGYQPGPNDHVRVRNALHGGPLPSATSWETTAPVPGHVAVINAANDLVLGPDAAIAFPSGTVGSCRWGQAGSCDPYTLVVAELWTSHRGFFLAPQIFFESARTCLLPGGTDYDLLEHRDLVWACGAWTTDGGFSATPGSVWAFRTEAVAGSPRYVKLRVDAFDDGEPPATGGEGALQIDYVSFDAP